MQYRQRKKAILLLEDGTVFHGFSAGKLGYATGELCFNTGMTGYQEVFTDPSYFGQLMITTNAHIGNYGVKKTEVESSEIRIAGLICKNLNPNFSRAAGDGNVNDYFINNDKVIITDVDTRAVVRHIRDKGAMNAIISNDVTNIDTLKNILDKVPSMQGLELSSKVSTKEAYYFGNDQSRYKVAVLDLGIKTNILRCLAERDCYLKVFPINIGKEKLNKVEEFFVKLNLKNLEPFFDPEVTLAKTFSLRGVPTSIFINKQGEEFARVLGDLDFNDEDFLKWIEKYN